MQPVLMKMYRSYSRGSAAPLALLFTLVSMSFTAAYLKNSFSQSAMEKYRYAEWRALYAFIKLKSEWICTFFAFKFNLWYFTKVFCHMISYIILLYLDAQSKPRL